MDDDDNDEEDTPSMPTGPVPSESTTQPHPQGDHQSSQADQTAPPSASIAPDVYAHTPGASSGGLGADPHARQAPSAETPGSSQQGFSQSPTGFESNTNLALAGSGGRQHQQQFGVSAQQQPEQPPSATQSAGTAPVQSPPAALIEVEISNTPLAEPRHAADSTVEFGHGVSNSHAGEVSRHSGSVTEPAPNSQPLPSQQAGQSQRHAAAAAASAQGQQRESQDAAQDRMARVQGSEAGPGVDAGVRTPARQLPAPQLTAQLEPQHAGTHTGQTGQEGELSLPAERTPMAPPPAEGLVPSRPPPAPPLASERSGRVLVPWRPAPSAPDQDPAQSLAQQGSMPAPAQTAPSLLPHVQGSLPVSVQGQNALNRPSPVSGLPLEGQGRLGETTSRALPQDLPSRQGFNASQAAGPSDQQGLEGMLGNAAPDVEGEEEESEASAQDRQKFMQSLQSPDRGSTRTKNLAKGFGRMRAKAKDLMQARNAGAASSGPAGQPAPAQGASHTPTDAELGRGGRLARDMTMMLAGLKKPANQ